MNAQQDNQQFVATERVGKKAGGNASINESHSLYQHLIVEVDTTNFIGTTKFNMEQQETFGKEQEAELNSLIALEMLLETKRDAYIEENGCEAYSRLPSHQSFKLNYKKWKRLQDLKVLETEHDFNNY